MGMTTTLLHGTRTLTPGGNRSDGQVTELLQNYLRLIRQPKVGWTEHLRLRRLLGKGGQGVVYLSERRGADNFTLPVALKFFSPERFDDERNYREVMERMAHISSRVALIQHDNLLDVQNFIERRQIRVLEMEWVDGYDLDKLLAPDMLERAKTRVGQKRWVYINNVVATAGQGRTRLKPGMAVAIIRDCLGALAALHREEIVHGDIKPSNIMLKRTGIAKIVDIGSAFEMCDPPRVRTCTLAYAAPEVLDNRETTPRSDLCSLGYVLIELLAGRQTFAGIRDMRDLQEAKRALPLRLHEILPEEVLRCELLCTFLRSMVAADPVRRFPSAEAAELLKEGAAAFHRQLVIGDLSSEYGNDIRLWLEELKDLDTTGDVPSEAA
jgi:serine/threonine-protein kinase